MAVFSKQNWTYLSQLERFKATFTLALAQSKGNIRINFLNCSGTLQKLADLRDYNGLARMGSDLSLRQLCQIAPFVLNRHEHMVVKLLEFGADLEARTQGGSTALACAAYHGHEYRHRFATSRSGCQWSPVRGTHSHNPRSISTAQGGAEVSLPSSSADELTRLIESKYEGGEARGVGK